MSYTDPEKQKKASHESYLRNKEKIRQRSNAYKKTEKHKLKRRASEKKYREANRDKRLMYNARWKLRVRDGLLTKRREVWRSKKYGEFAEAFGLLMELKKEIKENAVCQQTRTTPVPSGLVSEE